MSIKYITCTECDEEVEIDIDDLELELDDILDYVFEAGQIELESIKALVISKLGGSETLYDDLKWQLLRAAAEKYTLEELEQRLK